MKESFTVQIRLDFADRDEAVSGLDEEFGIAPEIAAIEDLLLPGRDRGRRQLRRHRNRSARRGRGRPCCSSGAASACCRCGSRR